jgi:cell division protein FtsQ
MDHRGRELPKVEADLNGNWQAPDAPGQIRHQLRPAPPPTSPPGFDFGHAYNPARMRQATPGGLDLRRRTMRRWCGVALIVVAATAAVAIQKSAALDRDRIATLLGFGIEQVSLTGHRFTADADLFEALDLKTARSLASFDPQATRRRFENLPWVQSIEISRVWPNELAIRVTERRPYAVWERGDTAELIDVTGRQLGPVKRDAELDLPRIAGEGANAAAARLFSALDLYPAIKGHVLRATRLSDRRWTLELTNGGRIHLPADGETSALVRLAAEPQLSRLVAEPGQIIDLRSPSKIAIRNGITSRAGGG